MSNDKFLGPQIVNFSILLNLLTSHILCILVASHFHKCGGVASTLRIGSALLFSSFSSGFPSFSTLWFTTSVLCTDFTLIGDGALILFFSLDVCFVIFSFLRYFLGRPHNLPWRSSRQHLRLDFLFFLFFYRRRVGASRLCCRTFYGRRLLLFGFIPVIFLVVRDATTIIGARRFSLLKPENINDTFLWQQ